METPDNTAPFKLLIIAVVVAGIMFVASDTLWLPAIILLVVSGLSLAVYFITREIL